MKKEYSLALGWWAAIWLLHIWIIKYIEEQNIIIKEVSGTSMWSIIASLYALWISSKEMLSFAEKIKMLKMLDLDLSSGLLKWNKIVKKLYEIIWDELIEKQKIKLKIITTNISTWEKKVFTKWKIIDAIRASISIPWIFKPQKIWWDYYIDWWVLNNLPIEVLEWKNIIAVSALKKIEGKIKDKKKLFWLNLKTWFFNMNAQILERALLLMMKSNELKSLKTKNKNIIFIHPDTPWIEIYSFSKVKKLVDIWYKEISEVTKL